MKGWGENMSAEGLVESRGEMASHSLGDTVALYYSHYN